jgi:hypothetical protein
MAVAMAMAEAHWWLPWMAKADWHSFLPSWRQPHRRLPRLPKHHTNAYAQRNSFRLPLQGVIELRQPRSTVESGGIDDKQTGGKADCDAFWYAAGLATGGIMHMLSFSVLERLLFCVLESSEVLQIHIQPSLQEQLNILR